MPIGAAITAIVTIFLCCWTFNMARDPRHWRLWWMSRFGIPDLNSTREQRRRQELHLAILASPPDTTRHPAGCVTASPRAALRHERRLGRERAGCDLAGRRAGFVAAGIPCRSGLLSQSPDGNPPARGALAPAPSGAAALAS